MTASTPDLLAIKSRADAATPAPWTPGDTNPQAVVARNGPALHALTSSCAHVMSIRSMAAFHRTNKIDLPLADLLDSHADIISDLGDVIADLIGERDRARRDLANAPHEERCLSLRLVTHPCTCWKAEVTA